MLMKITLGQIHLQAGNIEHNLDRARQGLEEAASQGGELVLLPELWSSGYDLSNARFLSAATPAILSELQAISQTHQLRIGGSLLQQEDELVFNSFFLVQPNLPSVVYRKVHLFQQMDEHQWLSPGNHLVTTNFNGLKAGLGICYDLRFPEFFRSYALHGIELFLLCAEWPVRRINHWNTLLRARAIENQGFLAAVNAVGTSGNVEYGGCSAVISPWGETLLQASADHEDVITCEIDPAQIARVRSHLPVFSDRRPEVYKKPIFDSPETS